MDDGAQEERLHLRAEEPTRIGKKLSTRASNQEGLLERELKARRQAEEYYLVGLVVLS